MGASQPRPPRGLGAGWGPHRRSGVRPSARARLGRRWLGLLRLAPGTDQPWLEQGEVGTLGDEVTLTLTGLSWILLRPLLIGL